MVNDCTNLINDNISLSSGGCRRCYCSCPFYIRDNMDMGCGGCCYEPPVKEDKGKEGSSEKVKKSDIRDKQFKYPQPSNK